MRYDLRQETKRQLFHFGFGTVVALLFWLNWIDAWWILGLLVLGILLSAMQRNHPLVVLEWFLNHFERDDARFHGAGAIAVLLGMFFAMVFFPQAIALAAILALAWGDSASTFFGKWLGKAEWPWSHKTYIGSAFGFGFAFLGMALFVPVLHALITASIVMLIESVEINNLELDDNLVIPVFAGVILLLL